MYCVSDVVEPAPEREMRRSAAYSADRSERRLTNVMLYEYAVTVVHAIGDKDMDYRVFATECAASVTNNQTQRCNCKVTFKTTVFNTIMQ